MSASVNRFSLHLRRYMPQTLLGAIVQWFRFVSYAPRCRSDMKEVCEAGGSSATWRSCTRPASPGTLTHATCSTLALLDLHQLRTRPWLPRSLLQRVSGPVLIVVGLLQPDGVRGLRVPSVLTFSPSAWHPGRARVFVSRRPLIHDDRRPRSYPTRRRDPISRAPGYLDDGSVARRHPCRAAAVVHLLRQRTAGALRAPIMTTSM